MSYVWIISLNLHLNSRTCLVHQIAQVSDRNPYTKPQYKIYNDNGTAN